jgi:hypothetical protein
MPDVSRCPGHQNSISGPQAESKITPIFIANKEDTIATEADTDKTSVTFLADVPVYAQGVTRTVEIDDSGLSIDTGKEMFQ